MATTQPIRHKEDICLLKDYFLEKKEYRNYTMITLGINTPLRISDMLLLTWQDVFIESRGRWRQHITVVEQKTGKTSVIALNNSAISALDLLYQHVLPSPTDYIFKSRNAKNKPISRSRAYSIIRTAAEEIGLEERIRCHSLRKTYGYHAWKNGVPPAVIMDIYNHSSIEITKRYLSINQDEKDSVTLSLNL